MSNITNAAQLPVINISGDEDVVATELVNAAIEHGFLYIKNTGADIAHDELKKAFAIVRSEFYYFKKEIEKLTTKSPKSYSTHLSRQSRNAKSRPTIVGGRGCRLRRWILGITR